MVYWSSSMLATSQFYTVLESEPLHSAPEAVSQIQSLYHGFPRQIRAS